MTTKEALERSAQAIREEANLVNAIAMQTGDNKLFVAVGLLVKAVSQIDKSSAMMGGTK